MDILFSKMQSLGNDFVVIDATRQMINLSAAQIRKMADRRFGIGCDQLLMVGATDKAACDFSYRIFNADGTEVGQCGNGARCVARFVQLKQLSDKTEWRLVTLSSIIRVALVNEEVVVEMPVPSLLPTVDDALAALDLGNPHLVFQVDDVDELDLQLAVAPYLQHAAFPEGVNIGFMQIIDPAHLRLRVYERGSGLTLACGSGACAAVVAGRLRGLLENEVQVDQVGGACWVNWQAEGQPVFLRGPAEHCFDGIWPEK